MTIISVTKNKRKSKLSVPQKILFLIACSPLLIFTIIMRVDIPADIYDFVGVVLYMCNSKTCIPWFQKAAAAGSNCAGYTLGEIYNGYTKLNVPKNVSEAFRWYSLASLHYSHLSAKSRRYNREYQAYALNNLGIMYAHGIATTKDPSKAVQFYQRAIALTGLKEAYYNLGYAYERGVGLPQNYNVAAQNYRIAAHQGDICAMNDLGNLYAKNQITNQNENASYWFIRASNNGIYQVDSSFKYTSNYPKEALAQFYSLYASTKINQKLSSEKLKKYFLKTYPASKIKYAEELSQYFDQNCH